MLIAPIVIINAFHVLRNHLIVSYAQETEFKQQLQHALVRWKLMILEQLHVQIACINVQNVTMELIVFWGNALQVPLETIPT